MTLDTSRISGDTGHLADHNTLHTKANRWVDVKEHGATGDGTTDDTTAIQAAVDALGDGVGGSGIRGGVLYFPPGHYRITDKITFSRWVGVVQGSGVGNTPAHSTPGSGSAVMWDGDNLTPMFEVDDSRHIVFADLRWEGNDTNPPTYGVEMVNSGGTSGTNAFIDFQRCWIGRTPWPVSGVSDGNGAIDACIGYTGTNTNNDQWLLDRCYLRGTTYGLYLPNGQSIWGEVRGTEFDRCGTGIYTEASLTMLSPQFNACGIDLDIAGTTTRVTCHHWWSEGSGLIAKIARAAQLAIYGGQIRLDQISDYIFDMYFDNGNGSGAQTLCVENVKFDALDSNVGSPVIRFGRNGNTNNTIIKVDCVNGTGGGLPASVLSQVNIAAGSDRGVIEWLTYTGSDFDQFRNEIAGSGTGTRTTLDTTVWDSPVASS